MTLAATVRKIEPLVIRHPREARHNAIVAFLKHRKHDGALTREIAERFEVSRRTVHRDLRALAAQGRVFYNPEFSWSCAAEYKKVES